MPVFALFFSLILCSFECLVSQLLLKPNSLFSLQRWKQLWDLSAKVKTKLTLVSAVKGKTVEWLLTREFLLNGNKISEGTKLPWQQNCHGNKITKLRWYNLKVFLGIQRLNMFMIWILSTYFTPVFVIITDDSSRFSHLRC